MDRPELVLVDDAASDTMDTSNISSAAASMDSSLRRLMLVLLPLRTMRFSRRELAAMAPSLVCVAMMLLLLGFDREMLDYALDPVLTNINRVFLDTAVLHLRASVMSLPLIQNKTS